MNRSFRYLDKPLLIVSLLLFIFGLIMVFSASNVTAYMKYATSPYNYFVKQGIFLIGGIILFFIMIRFNTKFYGIVSWVLMIGIIVSLVALLIIGKTKNQAASWFELFGFTIQPSEFVKVVSIIWLANYYEEKKERLSSWFVTLFPVVICMIVAGLIFLQPDLGTTIIYALLVALIFFSEPIPTHMKVKLVIIGIALAFIGVMALNLSGKNFLLDRQLERFNFLRPCDRLLDDGNQVCNGYIAMNNGGVWGKGLGNSTQKYLYLPEPYTDFIFTIMVEELGCVIGVILILFYMFILYRILVIGRSSYTNRGCTICYGVFLYITLHIFINLMGILGLMPMTGVPLPFMSYGGSFTLCLIAALTAVERVSIETGIRNNLKTDVQPKLKKKVKKVKK